MVINLKKNDLLKGWGRGGGGVGGGGGCGLQKPLSKKIGKKKGHCLVIYFQMDTFFANIDGHKLKFS